MKFVTIYTDGACSGNPGPGGAAAIIIYKNHVKEISEGYKKTTNNRMELRAVILGLTALKEKCNIDLYTDSMYVKNGITKWIKNWSQNNWRTANKQNVKNKDLWIRIDKLCQYHNVEFHWVKAHNQDTLNTRVDMLAVSAVKSKNKKEDKHETIN